MLPSDTDLEELRAVLNPAEGESLAAAARRLRQADAFDSLVRAIYRLRATRCPTMKFGFTTAELAAALRDELGELDGATDLGSIRGEAADILATSIHLGISVCDGRPSPNGVYLEDLMRGVTRKINGRLDLMRDRGVTWEGAKVIEREVDAFRKSLTPDQRIAVRKLTESRAETMREIGPVEPSSRRCTPPPVAWEEIEGMQVAGHHGCALVVFRRDVEGERWALNDEDEQRWAASVDPLPGYGTWTMERIASEAEAKAEAVGLAERIGAARAAAPPEPDASCDPVLRLIAGVVRGAWELPDVVDGDVLKEVAMEAKAHWQRHCERLAASKAEAPLDRLVRVLQWAVMEQHQGNYHDVGQWLRLSLWAIEQGKRVPIPYASDPDNTIAAWSAEHDWEEPLVATPAKGDAELALVNAIEALMLKVGMVGAAAATGSDEARAVDHAIARVVAKPDGEAPAAFDAVTAYPDVGPFTEPPPGGRLYIHDWRDGVGARARYQVRFAGETWYVSPADAAKALAEYRGRAGAGDEAAELRAEIERLQGIVEAERDAARQHGASGEDALAALQWIVDNNGVDVRLLYEPDSNIYEVSMEARETSAGATAPSLAVALLAAARCDEGQFVMIDAAGHPVCDECEGLGCEDCDAGRPRELPHGFEDGKPITAPRRLEHWRDWAALFDPFPEQPPEHDNERRFRVNWWIEMLAGTRPREGRLVQPEHPADPPEPGTRWVYCWSPDRHREDGTVAQLAKWRWWMIDEPVADLVAALQGKVPTSQSCGGHKPGELAHVWLADGRVLVVLPDWPAFERLALADGRKAPALVCLADVDPNRQPTNGERMAFICGAKRQWERVVNACGGAWAEDFSDLNPRFCPDFYRGPIVGHEKDVSAGTSDCHEHQPHDQPTDEHVEVEVQRVGQAQRFRVVIPLGGRETSVNVEYARALGWALDLAVDMADHGASGPARYRVEPEAAPESEGPT